MKIDLVTTMVDSKVNSIVKSNKEDTKFLSVLENNTEDNGVVKDTSDKETEIEEELLKLVLSLMNNQVINSDDEVTEAYDITSINSHKDGTELEKVNIIRGVEYCFNNETILIEENIINTKSEDVDLIKKKLESILGKAEDNTVENDSIDKNIIFKSYKDSSDTNLSYGISNGEANNKFNDGTTLISNYRVINYTKVEGLEKDESILLDFIDEGDRKSINKQGVDSIGYEAVMLKSPELSIRYIDETNDIQPNIIRKQYIVEDVVQAIEYLQDNNVEQLSIKVNPRELGEINIKLIKSKIDNKVIITSANKDILKLINENLKDIENHLDTMNIKVDKISVEIRNDNQNDFSQNLNQHFKENDSKEQRKDRFIKNQRNAEEISEVSEDENINLLA